MAEVLTSDTVSSGVVYRKEPQKNVWHPETGSGCGCGGGRKDVQGLRSYVPPEGLVVMVFNTNRQVQRVGKSGTRYTARVNQIALDVKTEDAEGFLGSLDARWPSAVEFVSYTGYKSQMT